MAGEQKTFDDIAGFITDDADAGSDENQTSPTVGEEEDVTDTSEVEEEGGESEEEQEELDLEEDDEQHDEQAGEDDSPQVLEVNDEDVVEVMVDGKLEEWTLSELKRAASGEGAIEKRLTAATEEQKAAHAERTAWQTERAKQTESLQAAFNALHTIVLQPHVEQPPETLRQTDPQQYLLQQDAFQQDQARIQALQGQIQSMYGQIGEDIQKSEAGYRKAQAAKLAERLPILKDEKKGPARQKMIMEAADYYGFSADEIKLAADHRLFLMAHDAALYRASQVEGKRKGKEAVLEKAKAKTGKPARTIRSGSVAKKVSRARAQEKRRNASKKKAASSGKLDDVANFLLS